MSVFGINSVDIGDYLGGRYLVFLNSQTGHLSAVSENVSVHPFTGFIHL